MNSSYLSELIHDYKQQSGLNAHLSFYKNQPTIEDAIDKAAMAIMANGKKHPHQWRLKKSVLAEVREALLKRRDDLQSSTSFAQIKQIVSDSAVHGFGELAIYDTALRLGYYLQQLPSEVYLHAGTRKGANTLTLNVSRASIRMEEFREEFHSLQPHEIEDFLCIYKEELANPRSKGRTGSSTCFPVQHVGGTTSCVTTKNEPVCWTSAPSPSID